MINDYVEPFKFELKTKKETITIPGASDSNWFKLNAGQSGFFRVKYSGIHFLAGKQSNVYLNS